MQWGPQLGQSSPVLSGVLCLHSELFIGNWLHREWRPETLHPAPRIRAWDCKLYSFSSSRTEFEKRNWGVKSGIWIKRGFLLFLWDENNSEISMIYRFRRQGAKWLKTPALESADGAGISPLSKLTFLASASLAVRWEQDYLLHRAVVRINETTWKKSSAWERHFARAQEITVVMMKMMIWNWHFVRHEHFRASHSGLKRKNQKWKKQAIYIL